MNTRRSSTPTPSPAWTDSKAHDPGITIMQAFVFVVGALGAGALWRWRTRRQGQ